MEVAEDQVDEVEWAASLEQTSIDKAIEEYQRLGSSWDPCDCLSLIPL